MKKLLLSFILTFFVLTIFVNTILGQSLNIYKDTVFAIREIKLRDTTISNIVKKRIEGKINYSDTLTKVATSKAVRDSSNALRITANTKLRANDTLTFLATQQDLKDSAVSLRALANTKLKASDTTTVVATRTWVANNPYPLEAINALVKWTDSTKIYLGLDAGNNNDYEIAIGVEAGNSNLADSTIFIGYQQGKSNLIAGRISIDPTSTTKPLIDGYAIGDSLVINGILTTKNPHAFLMFANKTDTMLLNAHNIWYKVGRNVPLFEFYDNIQIDSIGRDTIKLTKRGSYLINYHLTLSINDTKQNIELRMFNVTKNAPIPATVGNRSPTNTGDNFSIGNSAYCRDCAANDKIILQIRNVDTSGKYVTYKFGSISFQFIHQ